jgi:hypothetical protein
MDATAAGGQAEDEDFARPICAPAQAAQAAFPLVVGWIRERTPEPCAQVRILLGRKIERVS